MTIEMFADLKVAAGSFGVPMKTLSDTFSSLGGALTRASGKNHAAEQFKDLVRGMAVLVTVTDEAAKIDIHPLKPTTKQFKPKRKRVTDHEPFYIKYSKKRRR